MKVLVIDQDGCGLAFAWRCAQAGHQVRWFIKPSKTNNKEAGKGFPVTRIDNWISSIMWADLVFVTSNADFVPRLEFFKKKGVPYYGPSVASANLEIKRADGMKFLEKHGIEVPAYKTFKTLRDAELHVWKNENRFVFKTLGDNEDKSLSYCSKSPADLISRLQRWQKLNMNPKGEVMLQEFIPGIEVGVSRWTGSKGFIGLYNEHFEHKKLMNGEKGPNTGEMGTVQAYVENSKLGDEVLKPLEKDLVGLGHLGDVAVNCIIDEKGKPWPLEFTCRPGWPAFNIMMSSHKGDPCRWMKDAIDGKDALQCNTEVAIGVVLAQPDFPYGNKSLEETSDIPVYGINKRLQKYVQPQSIKIEKMPDMDGDSVIERPIWVTSGDYIAVVTALGKDIDQARKRVYETIDEIDVPDMLYRTDIGEKVKEKLPELHKQGYALAFK